MKRIADTAKTAKPGTVRERAIRVALLRGVCQTPAYVAHDQGFFADEGLRVEVDVAPTAWLVPHKLSTDEVQFAVMPWTRVAAEPGRPFVLLAGSGWEEAAIVLRRGLAESDVRTVAVPLRGGIKDLTAMGLIRSLGWTHVQQLRQPSGDGAIIAFLGQGAEAASMVEPYATMMEELGVGRVIKRTGDLWPGAPGCSLTTTAALRDREPDTVARFVRAFVRGATFVREEPARTADIAYRHIGIAPRFIRAALERNLPDVDALRNRGAMDQILDLMRDLGYLRGEPGEYLDLSFLDAAQGQ
jgi:NitT/TauT family transport system substrate-binding protein